ncbi:MAG: GNAT family N-acetyltransferase [Jatrophihabitans sp.]|uniref:GNAT family N-acetyltransferase n=1 Tax=Jatrophihabitans sp. TaxID=1932789 RepID=UPI003F81F643
MIAVADDGRAQFGDVVGDLVDLAPDAAVVEQRGELVRIDPRTVAIARLVPPSTAEELALEAVVARGWRPAEHAELGGWQLRADQGFTKRANSVLPLRPPGLPVGEAIEQAPAWYAERGLPLLFSVPTESRRLLDADLGERGFAPELDAAVMTTRLPGTTEPADGVELTAEPDDAWLARWSRGAESPELARAVLTRHDTVVFASVRDGGATIAIGRGVVDEDWLGVFAVEVAPERRREGLARRIVQALWGWGREHGAARSYLQVEVDSEPAVALYESLGYHVHHAYRYRRDPVAGPGVAPVDGC